MKVAGAFIVVGVLAALAAVSFADHERSQSRVAYSQRVFDRTLNGGAPVPPLVQPWYVEQPLLLGAAIVITATVIGLLLAIVVRLER